MPKDERSFAAGLVFAGLGATMVLHSLQTLDTGTARSMGPGYFPIMIGSVLLAVGLATLLTMRGKTRIDLPSWPWRQIAMVIAAILVFAIGLSRIGFLGSAFLMVLICSLARKETRLWQAAVTAAGITAFCTVVFVWGLGIPFKLY